jgi:hypothetical protein
MLIIIMLSIIKMIFIMLGVIVLIVIKLSVIMLSVIIVKVMANVHLPDSIVYDDSAGKP